MVVQTLPLETLVVVKEENFVSFFSHQCLSYIFQNKVCRNETRNWPVDRTGYYTFYCSDNSQSNTPPQDQKKELLRKLFSHTDYSLGIFPPCNEGSRMHQWFRTPVLLSGFPDDSLNKRSGETLDGSCTDRNKIVPSWILKESPSSQNNASWLPGQKISLKGLL